VVSSNSYAFWLLVIGPSLFQEVCENGVVGNRIWLQLLISLFRQKKTIGNWFMPERFLISYRRLFTGRAIRLVVGYYSSHYEKSIGHKLWLLSLSKALLARLATTLPS